MCLDLPPLALSSVTGGNSTDATLDFVPESQYFLDAPPSSQDQVLRTVPVIPTAAFCLAPQPQPAFPLPAAVQHLPISYYLAAALPAFGTSVATLAGAPVLLPYALVKLPPGFQQSSLYHSRFLVPTPLLHAVCLHIFLMLIFCTWPSWCSCLLCNASVYLKLASWVYVTDRTSPVCSYLCGAPARPASSAAPA